MAIRAPDGANNEWFVLGGTESEKGCNSLFLMVLGLYRAYVPLYIEWRISTGDMVRCHRSLTDRLTDFEG